MTTYYKGDVESQLVCANNYSVSTNTNYGHSRHEIMLSKTLPAAVDFVRVALAQYELHMAPQGPGYLVHNYGSLGNLSIIFIPVCSISSLIKGLTFTDSAFVAQEMFMC